MRMQITLPTELSYSKFTEKLRKVRPKLKDYRDTEKNLLEFELEKYPNCKIQFTPKQKIIINCKDMETFDNIIKELYSILHKDLLNIPVDVSFSDMIKINIYGMTYKEYEELTNIKCKVKAFLDFCANAREYKEVEKQKKVKVRA